MIGALLIAVSCYAPETWFHVIGGNVSREGIVADLDAIQSAGIAGIQFFHGGADWMGGTWPGVTNPIPCLSDQWEELVGFTAEECAKRGLMFKMQNCPGWSMSGGPWITAKTAMRKLVAFEPGQRPAFTAEDDYQEICTMKFPLARGTMISLPSPQSFNHAWAYQPEITFSVFADGKLVREWACPRGCWQDQEKMSFYLGGVYDPAKLRLVIRSPRGDYSAVKPEYSQERKLDNWEAKAGRALRSVEIGTDERLVRYHGWKELTFGHIVDRKFNGPAPAEATGWECDKLSKHGFRANWDGYLGKLLKGPLKGGKLKGTLVDSWECATQNWTPRMEAEFERMNGYKLREWLPALFGYVLYSEARTEQFLLDWRKTISRLIEDNYFGEIARLAHEHGMRVQFETAFGDVVPGDPLRYWKYADEPMCEFWSPFKDENGHVTSHDFKPVKPCVSAAHLYGKKRVSAEALTSFQLTYDESFQEWKVNCDRHFCRGVTHIVFHTFTHQPVVGSRPPGTSFGCGIGSPFLRGQTWWSYLREFTSYLEAIGRELERGEPAVDILMYLGDDYAHRPNESTEFFGGRYKYDYLNQDALFTRLDQLKFKVLWVPQGTYLEKETQERLATLERKGIRVVHGDFVPDWPSPLAELGLEPTLGWYERVDGEQRIFFTAETNGTSALHYPLAVTPALGWWKDVGTTPEEKAYSGTKLYTTSFQVPEGQDGRQFILDLGEIRDWATVQVNGVEAGRLWHRPYRCEIGQFLKPGKNEITVSVTSTWHNQLIFDGNLSDSERKTWTIGGPRPTEKLKESGWKGPAKIMITY